MNDYCFMKVKFIDLKWSESIWWITYTQTTADQWLWSFHLGTCWNPLECSMMSGMMSSIKCVQVMSEWLYFTVECTIVITMSGKLWIFYEPQVSELRACQWENMADGKKRVKKKKRWICKIRRIQFTAPSKYGFSLQHLQKLNKNIKKHTRSDLTWFYSSFCRSTKVIFCRKSTLLSCHLNK